MSDKVRFIIHGCPRGHQLTYDDIDEYNNYANFHTGGDTHVSRPSKPGEQFIEDVLTNGTVAYTYLRTGVYETNSSRPGTNYAAITIFVPTNYEIPDKEQFQQELKKFFHTEVLQKYTAGETENSDAWIRWNSNHSKLFYTSRDRPTQDMNTIAMSLYDNVVKKFIKTKQQHEYANTPAVNVTRSDTDDKTQTFTNATQKIKQLEEELEATQTKANSLRAQIEKLKQQQQQQQQNI